MNSVIFQQVSDSLNAIFPTEWVRAALVLAFMCTLMVAALFTYLNHYSQKKYFGRWTTAWLYYAVFLMAAIGLQETPEMESLVFARRACIGISALYLFFGNLEFARRPRSTREIQLAVLMMLAWSAVAAFRVQEILWITLPVFGLLGAASLYTSYLYLGYRKRYRGAKILAIGFFAWALHLAGLPFIGWSNGLDAILYLVSAIVALLIAMGMMVQMLEEAREQNMSIVNECQKGLVQCHVLEQEVSLSEHRYRALFEASSDANFLIDLETHGVREVNQAAYRLLSRGGGALVGALFTDICPRLQPLGKSMVEDRKRYEEFFRPLNEFRVFRTDGTDFMAQGEARLVQVDKRPMMQVTLHAISKSVKIEKQLRKAEKLSALGTLIAGVAHELNNPLAVIMGYSQLLSQRAEVATTIKSELKKIVHESERAAKIVRNLLIFARPREPEMTVVGIDHRGHQAVEIDDRHFRLARANDVQLEKRLAGSLPRTKADTNQIEQVLTNLISNGIQALAQHSAELRLVRVTTSVYGSYLRVTVEDTGPGITAEVLGKIFEPFYTTKQPGQGTGLGLSICQSIIEEHHGKIWVQSEPGSGAKFFIELPVIACDGETDPVADTEGATQPAVRVPLRGRRQHRVLVVDDEPGIVEVLKEALDYRGYLIDTAENGRVALEKVERERYDLILSDLRMPDMDGEKMYHAIRKIKPDLAGRIVFLTGDTVSHKARTFLEWTGNHWFSKPFSIGEVERTIANFLGPIEAPADATLSAVTADRAS